jgi:tRNA(Arg) A34 adenosine deaminase TadA
LTHEPDLFDAMALLHSRVSRVIYGLPDDIAGAIGGLDDLDVVEASQQSDRTYQSEDVMKLRTQKLRRPSLRLQEVRALNHHYTVYRMCTR